MKKKICIIITLILIAIMSFYISFYKENNSNRINMESAEETPDSFRILISGSNQKPEIKYDVLKSILDKYEGNIFFTRLTRKSETAGYIKYVYLTNLSYFNSFKLKNGHFLSLNELESDKFLSTRNTGKSNQTGQISEFAGDDVFEIHTLKSMVNQNIEIQGSAALQIKNSKNINDLIKDLNDSGIACSREPIYPETKPPFLYLFSIILFIVYILLSLLIFYDILSSYKKIGIKKMMGYKSSTIWAGRIFTIMTQEILIFFIIQAILTLLYIKDYNYFFYMFIKNLLLQNCLLFSLTFIFISIPFLYINKITISNMLKNKLPIKEILTLNTIVKFSLSLFIVIVFFSVYNQFTLVLSRYSSSFKIWETTKNYAVIPSIQDIPSADFLSSEEFLKSQKELYMFFNKKGAILADFNVYALNRREQAVKEQPIAYKRDLAEVNPNYLKSYEVYDTSGKKININETEKDYILLVPEHYKDSEDKILDYYKFVKEGYRGKSTVPSQKIKIIWIKDNQELFSYRIDVNPSEGYKVKDTIIRVITESNGDITDFDKVIAYSGNPFKIKTVNPENPSASIRPKLKEYNLSQYIVSIPSVYDAVSSDLKNYTNIILFLSMLLISIGAVILMIIIQNIYNYFQQYKIRLAVMKFHGYRIIDRYKSYFLLIAASWFIISVITGLIYKKMIFQVLIFNGVFFLIEVLISLFTLIKAEKKKLVLVTKGG